MAESNLIRSQLLAAHGITALFTLRSGGVSPPPFESLNFGPDDSEDNIARNMRILVEHGGLPDAPHQANQVHGAELLWCHGPGAMHTQAADILITDKPDTAIAVRTADCLPILIADPDQGIVAAVHAGWRGTAANVATTAVQAMLKSGATSDRLVASLGPCIGPCCFKVGEKAASALQASVSGADQYISENTQRTADLRAINRLQLLAAGVCDQHIECIDACTSCDADRFFSYRRDGAATGRHLAVVASPSST